jgi:hypothetical protein
MCRRSSLLTGEGVGGWDGAGAKSYDGEKARPSIHHSILSGRKESSPFCVSPSELLTGEGGGRGPESYDRKKAWPSIKRSIFPGYMEQVTRNKLAKATVVPYNSHLRENLRRTFWQEAIWQLVATRLAPGFGRAKKLLEINIKAKYVFGKCLANLLPLYLILGEIKIYQIFNNCWKF